LCILTVLVVFSYPLVVIDKLIGVIRTPTQSGGVMLWSIVWITWTMRRRGMNAWLSVVVGFGAFLHHLRGADGDRDVAEERVRVERATAGPDALV
jgi:hypothetical protein